MTQEPPPERPFLRWLRLGEPREQINLATRLELGLFLLILGVALATPALTPGGRPNAPLEALLGQETGQGGGICVYRRTTGIECGGCGLTRAFVQLAHARVVQAVKLNPMAPLVFLWACWRTVELLVLNISRRRLRIGIPPKHAWTGYGIAVLGFASLFVLRLVQGMVERAA